MTRDYKRIPSIFLPYIHMLITKWVPVGNLVSQPNPNEHNSIDSNQEFGSHKNLTNAGSRAHVYVHQLHEDHTQ